MKHKRTKVGETILAYAVLIVLSFLCLFFFYILLVNASRSHAELQRGFSWLPGGYFLENLKAVATDGNFPMFKGILNSLIVSTCSAALCTYFSALTAYGLYAYNFKFKKLAFTFIMAILVMPTQVTAMGFLRLMTNMGLYDTLWPLILPSIALGVLLHVQLPRILAAAVPGGSRPHRRFGRVHDLQPHRAADHEAGRGRAGYLLLCGVVEQLLRSRPDHPVQGQDDCAYRSGTKLRMNGTA